MEEKDVLEFAQTENNANSQTQPDTKEGKVEIKPYKVFGQDFSLSNPIFISYLGVTYGFTLNCFVVSEVFVFTTNL